MGCSSSKKSVDIVDTVTPVPDPKTKVEPGRPVERPEPKPVRQHSRATFHDKYILQNKLGKGAFAQVYLAKPSPNNAEFSSDRSFAAKVTDCRKRDNGQPLQEVDKRTKQNVQKEFDLLKSLSTVDSVLRVYESYFEEWMSIIIVEKCDSSLLAALDRLHELSERTFVQVFHQMFTGLDEMHKRLIAHRDIKPDNFLCKRPQTPGGIPQIKICDLGMAEQLPDERPSLRGVYGTAPFMAPEMLNKEDYGTQADVWSTFVVCYVLFIGKFPYQPAQANPKAMKAAVSSGHPAPSFTPSSSLPEISEHATSFLHIQFERDPKKRLSASQLLAKREVWDVESSGYGTHSLRPILNASKRCGAFDTRRVKEDENDIDTVMRQEQRRLYGVVSGSECSTRVGDSHGSTSERSQRSGLDGTCRTLSDNR